MKIENIIIIGAFAVGAFLVLKAQWARPSTTRTGATGTGGTYDGVFVGGLLDQQYRQGWGYGD